MQFSLVQFLQSSTIYGLSASIVIFLTELVQIYINKNLKRCYYRNSEPKILLKLVWIINMKLGF